MWQLLGFLLLTVNCQLSTAFGQSFKVANLNEVHYANAYSGADAGAKIAACLADMPGTGGVCDARGLMGTQTISSTVTVGNSSKPETLMLSLGVTYTCAVAPCFILDSNGHIEGAAATALPTLTAPPSYPAYTANTVIKLGNGVNPGARGIIESANFGTLTGTNGSTGAIPRNFSLRNLAVDGNRANNTSGMGIAIYGYQDTLENVQADNCASHGIWHELGASAPAASSVLVRGTHVKAHNNGGDGIHDIGPTDQMWIEVETALNNGHGIYAGKSGTSGGAGTSFWYAVDSYANGLGATGDGFRDEAGSIIYGAQLGAGNTGCGLKVNVAGGGLYDFYAVHENTGAGICVGSATVAPVYGTYRGGVYNNTGGELLLTNSGGSNHFDLTLIDFAGLWTSGSFAASDSYDLREAGGGSAHLVRLADGGSLGPIHFEPNNADGAVVNIGGSGTATTPLGLSIGTAATGNPFLYLYRNGVGAWKFAVGDAFGDNSFGIQSPGLGTPLLMKSAGWGSGEVLVSDPLTVTSPVTTTGQITSTVSPGAPPFVVASDTPVSLLTTQVHPRVVNCTSGTCAGAFQALTLEAYGKKALTAGTATVTVSPTFADTTNGSCTSQDNTAANYSKAEVTAVDTITLTGNGIDVVAFHCDGIWGGAGGGGGGGGGGSYGGPALPTTAISVSGGYSVWSNPANVEAEDGSYATATQSGGIQWSNLLRTTGYGFSVPGGATVDGILVVVKKKTISGTCGDHTVMLVKGGSETGDNFADLITPWSSTEETWSYGGPSNLWSTAWTPSDINSSNFGVSISASGANSTCGIDSMKITVYYH